jgi:hypothetical protein
MVMPSDNGQAERSNKMANTREKQQHVRKKTKKITAATVIAALRRGESLLLEHKWYGRCWVLSSGLRIDDAIAKTVVKNRRVKGVGDSLFPDATPSQTWQWI